MSFLVLAWIVLLGVIGLALIALGVAILYGLVMDRLLERDGDR